MTSLYNETSHNEDVTDQTIQIDLTTEDPTEESFKEIINAIRWCFVPIVAVGTCTNFLNVIVFSSRRMLGLSTVNFLLTLAIADFGILYFQVS